MLIFTDRAHQKVAPIRKTARFTDSPEGMLLPAPTERNIRQSYMSDVVTLSQLSQVCINKAKGNAFRRDAMRKVLHQISNSSSVELVAGVGLGKESTPLIRLHKHAFAVQPDAVHVLVFSFYDFSECHKIRGALRLRSRARREGKTTKRMV